MTETRVYVTERVHRLEGRNTDEFFKMADAIQHEGEYWLAVRAEKDEFHLRRAVHRPAQWGDDLYVSTGRAHGDAYRPIHESMTAEDIEGATYAFDDGTAWHFAHCSPHEQIDFAAAAERYTYDQMQDAINKTVIALGETGTTETLEAAKKKHAALVRFARAAGRDAHARVVQATLGHYHREPHNDHLRDLAVTAIQAVLAAWDDDSDTDRPRVKADADAAVTRLTTTHSIEWRPVRQKRLDDAAAAAGTDPVAGYEYVYASSIFPAVITGASNLPSPTWPFDGLRNGRVLRGSFFYYDGEPVPNRFQPWAIRFKRPVPEDAVPGASIGSVPWEQEAAYQPPIPEED